MYDVMQYEVPVRLGIFFSVFLIMANLELILPRRDLRASKSRRWGSNIGITLINTIVVRLLFPTAAIGVAITAEAEGWGLLNITSPPFWLSVVTAVLLLDLAIYVQHVLMHKIPILWRLHRMHHVDLDIDVTTGARFHPVEIILSMLIKFAAIAVLGAPALAVLIFEVLLNATAMFNHSNVRLPLGLDRAVRTVLVTPDMHRVHHSVIRRETDSNYGFNLPWWDRLFKTYRAQPEAGHTSMGIGVADIRDEKLCINLIGMLKLPFLRNVSK